MGGFNDDIEGLLSQLGNPGVVLVGGSKVLTNEIAGRGYPEYNSLAAGLSYSSTDHDWSIRLGWSHGIRQDGWGENFQLTDVYTLGGRRVFR